jgi:hypothetical protein
MRHGFWRKQFITRVPALVLVTLLFCTAAFVAIHQSSAFLHRGLGRIHQGRGESKRTSHRRATIEQRSPVVGGGG